MCEQKGFNEERMRNGCKKLVKARKTTTQGRLDSFFKVLPSPTNPANKKRKLNDTKPGSAKKGKASSVFKRGK